MSRKALIVLLTCLLLVGGSLVALVSCQSGSGDINSEKAKFDTPTKAVITPDPVDAEHAFVFVLNAYTGTVSVIRVSDQKVIWGKGDKGEDPVLGVGDFPKDLAISPDGATVYVTDTVEGNLYAISSGDWAIESFAIGFSGGRPKVDSEGAVVWLLDQRGRRLVPWDAQTHELGNEIVLEHEPFAFDLAPDGSAIYVTTLDGLLLRIDGETHAIDAQYQLVGTPGEVMVHPDGSEVYALSSGPPRMFVLDTATGEERTLELLGIPRNLGPSPDGALIYLTNSDGYLYVYNVALGRPCGASATTPEFYDKGPQSDTTISTVEVTDCITQTLSWKLIYDQPNESWIVRSIRDEGEHDEKVDTQSLRADEDRRYVSDYDEVSFTINSGERWSSEGDRFVFQTDAGIKPIVVGRMPDSVVTTPIPDTPEYHYIFVVNTGTHNVSILTSVEFDYDETIN
ncbi:MAG: hypothetical protein P9M14_02500 [Candidatus Alcyoniella australis]|nr:hypothetical protein [Candidatus Alcyoniella australis]